MKEVPKPIVALFLVLAFAFIFMVIFQLTHTNNADTRNQYLDQLQVETGNPQPAGQNIAP